MKQSSYDAVVIGSGPNGLSAAIALAQAGWKVQVREATGVPGGGCRSEELTLPGFVHDVCSAVHPLGAASPFFRTLPLAEHGLKWVHPQTPLAHPFDDGTAATLERSVEATAATLAGDGARYADWISPYLRNWPRMQGSVLGPLRVPPHPLALMRFAREALRPAGRVARARFDQRNARGLFAGLAGHAALPLEKRPSAGFGLVLAILAHTAGWPFAVGGSQRITDALASYLRSLGGEVVCSAPVNSLDELPSARSVLCDITPRQLLAIAGDRLPKGFQRSLSHYRYGPAAFKVDWALRAPIPWTAKACARAGTVHLGGTLEEIAKSERAAWKGGLSERPFLIVTQPSLFDSTRAPAGQHTAWAYCHLPHGSGADMTERIEAQMERFAPGFRSILLARHVRGPAEMERHNANLVGGDIFGGSQTLRQLFLRPTRRLYGTPLKGVYLCSASTPPGGGVHGMCGYFAAQRVLADFR